MMIRLILVLALAAATASMSCGMFERMTAPPRDVIHDTCVYYVKVPKTSSTTISGVMRRMARNHGLAGVRKAGAESAKGARGAPHVWATHATYPVMEKASRTARNRKVWWFASVRNPAERALSEFYHLRVTRHHVRATSEEKLKFMRGVNNTMLSWMSPDPTTVADPLPLYDHVIVQERLVDSLLLMLFKFDLSLADILYITTKNSSDGRADDVTRQPMVPNRGVRAEGGEAGRYLRSMEFRVQNKHDYDMYRNATMQIQRGVANVEPTEWREAMAIYRHVEHRIHTECDPPPGKGLKGWDCFFRDEGCADKCITRVYQEFVDGGCKE